MAPTRKAMEHMEKDLSKKANPLYLIYFAHKEVDYELLAQKLGEKPVAKVKFIAKKELDNLSKQERMKNKIEEAFKKYVSIAFSDASRFDKITMLNMLLPKTYYTILKGDGDEIGKILRGKLRIDAEEYAEILIEKVRLPKEVAEVGLNSALVIKEFEQDSESRTEQDGEALTLIPSPAYVSTLSRALMVTALKEGSLFSEKAESETYIALSP